MATQKLLFGSADGTTLFSTDGTTVTQLANDFSSPAFLADPLYGKVTSVRLEAEQIQLVIILCSIVSVG